jgi:hypothetical protein
VGVLGGVGRGMRNYNKNLTKDNILNRTDFEAAGATILRGIRLSIKVLRNL